MHAVRADTCQSQMMLCRCCKGEALKSSKKQVLFLKLIVEMCPPDSGAGLLLCSAMSWCRWVFGQAFGGVSADPEWGAHGAVVCRCCCWKVGAELSRGL